METTSSVSLPKGATKIGKYSMTRELDIALTGFAQDYSTDKMRFKVKVTNSKIVFESSYKVLGHSVPLYVYFTPVVSESEQLYFMFRAFGWNLETACFGCP
ncbi:MAG: DUF2140 family protein [Streptococcus salivarius]